MSIMCDWLSGVINIRHKCIKQGEIVSIDQDGEVEYRIAKRQTFEGSYSTKFTLKSQGEVDEHGYSNEIYFYPFYLIINEIYLDFPLNNYLQDISS